MTMRQVTGNMTSVVKGMDKAMETMNLERVRRSHPPSPLLPHSLFIHLTIPYLSSCAAHASVALNQSNRRQQISLVMDKFESQFSDLDVQTSYMEDAMGSTTAVSTPQDQVDSLMRQMAEEANIELQQDLAAKEVPDLAPPQRAPAVGEEDGSLADRLRALRPAT
jgi:charged multivesicular body protein 1